MSPLLGASSNMALRSRCDRWLLLVIVSAPVTNTLEMSKAARKDPAKRQTPPLRRSSATERAAIMDVRQ